MSFAVQLAVGAVGESIATEMAWSLASEYALSTTTFDAIVSSGFAVGAIAANYLFPIDKADKEGPRVLDGLNQVSVYGKFIPIIYGKNRLAGNVIWSKGIREERTEESSGGKGGGGQTTINYAYYCTFAIALCEGELSSFNKIWFDADLVYNSETGNSPISNFLNKVTFYYGTENQLPDPIIEAVEGFGNAPSYKNIAYIVFDDILLSDWSNRIPNITVELNRIGKANSNTKLYNYQNIENLNNEISVIDLILKSTKFVIPFESATLPTSYLDSITLITTTAYVYISIPFESATLPTSYLDSVILISTTAYVYTSIPFESATLPTSYIDSITLITTTAYVYISIPFESATLPTSYIDSITLTVT